MSLTARASRPRLLVVAPYAVVPPRYGGPLRVFNLCRELSRRYEVRQFAQQVQRSQLAPRLDPLVQQVTPHYHEYSSRDPLSVALYALTSLRWGAPPFWQGAALRAHAPRWLRRELAQADLIQVEHPWQFAWVHRQNRGRAPLVYDAMDVETALYTEQLLAAPPSIARRIVRTIAAQERFAAQHADLVVTASEDDRAAFVGRHGVPPERCVLVPNGVDCAAFQPASPQLRAARKAELGLAGRQVVLFAGSLHRPNVEAVQRIVALASAWPDPSICFLVVGTVGRAFAELQHPALRVTGSVDSTRPFFEAADLALNPILAGTGTNLKQLEFMAMGLATLATPTGARGLGARDGQQLFVRPVEQFAEQLRWMLARPDQCAAVGRAARAHVEQRFDWRALADQLSAAYAERFARQLASEVR